MNWHFAYTPYIWLSVFSILLLIALAVYSGHRRGVPGALLFVIGCLFGAGYAFGTLMETAAADLSTKIFWVKFQGPLQLPIVITITCFILEYAWPGRWLSRRNLALLSIPCLLSLGLILTNDLHHLIWRGFVYEGRVIILRGPVYWIFLVYAFVGLEALNLIAFGWLFWRSSQHRWPVVIMLTGQFVGRTVYTLEAAQRFQSFLHFDILGMTFEFLMYAFALFGYRIFDPIRLACQTAIEQLQTGMLVFDPQGRIISLNPAAAAIFGPPAKSLLGCSIQNLLPTCTDLAGEFQTAGTVRTEISLGSGLDAHHYLLEVSALNDWRGSAVGHLLLLHDVTKQKQAQEQLVEQQRALAMLQERERLARELHDSIGQVLGYASFQLEAVSKLLLDGQAGTAIIQLDRLAEIVREAHADVREYILDLHAAPASYQSFFAALRHYLDSFTHNYNIQTLLHVDERLGDEPYPLDARMQVFRIVQEALSNARKHGQARCVQVTFFVEDQLVCMVIQDDGIGFNPNQSEMGDDNHFGLRFMRERAEELGGHLEVISRSGQGTRVVTRAPMKTIRPIQESEAANA